MEEIKKLLEDCECAGYRCPHEISGKHYVMISEDVDDLIDLAVSKERERVTSKTDEVWDLLCQMDTNIKSEKEYAKDIINLINTK